MPAYQDRHHGELAALVAAQKTMIATEEAFKQFKAECEVKVIVTKPKEVK